MMRVFFMGTVLYSRRCSGIFRVDPAAVCLTDKVEYDHASFAQFSPYP